MSDNNLLDLDAVVPPSRYIKLQGKTLEVLPVTLNQLIELSRFEDRLNHISDTSQIKDVVKQLLGPIIPAILTDDELDFNSYQLRELIKFAEGAKQGTSSLSEEEYKKKVEGQSLSSQNKSPDSVDSTQDTPQDQPSTNTP